MVMNHYLADWRNILWSLAMAAIAVLLALALHGVVAAVLKRMARLRNGMFYGLLVQYQQRPTRLLFPLLALLAVIPAMPLAPLAISRLNHVNVLALIGCAAWMAVAMLNVLRDYIAQRHAHDANDNLAVRRLRTQVQVLRHIMVVLIVVITIAIMVMTFPSARHVGESLFASAGVAAVVAGLAARTTLSNLLAGVQIALSQPIRLDDVVIVEGEWGWIEEITMTYVVVRIWDLRRLVLPISYFIEKPFQNWTRNASDLLGTVFVYTDYTVPVDEVRKQLLHILQGSGMWDGKVWGLQVSNASERTVELRALMSSPNSSAAWDLRCYVREQLIAFLQERYPQSLPRTRAEIAELPSTVRSRDGNGNRSETHREPYGPKNSRSVA
ncbi:MAG TPA: mechanosensitive ion channel domain-containing protein [Candidatus Binatia bacterium]|nr:mechanosensitive ion channel domain-containing protein [Candidatus Binatia bacterium]